VQGTHYRAAVNYTQRALEEASERLYSFYQAVRIEELMQPPICLEGRCMQKCARLTYTACTFPLGLVMLSCKHLPLHGLLMLRRASQSLGDMVLHDACSSWTHDTRSKVLLSRAQRLRSRRGSRQHSVRATAARS
jgi:hypothetical protein